MARSNTSQHRSITLASSACLAASLMLASPAVVQAQPAPAIQNNQQTGFVVQNGQTYYVENGVRAHGERAINGHWYYFAPEMKTGFVYIPGHNKWVYYNEQGHMLYGEQPINGHWYNFDPITGARKTGFTYIPEHNKWVYYNEQGQMLYGEQAIGGHWYNFDKITGERKTGFTYIPEHKKWVYYNEQGQMVKGEAPINGHWYNFDLITGERKTGFVYIPEHNKWVYYNKQGQMLYGEQAINGAWYLLDSITGAVKYGWQNLPEKRVFYDRVTGKMQYGWQTIDGKTYHFNEITGALDNGLPNPAPQNPAGAQVTAGTQTIEYKMTLDQMAQWQIDGNPYIKDWTRERIRDLLDANKVPRNSGAYYQFLDVRALSNLSAQNLNDFINTNGATGKLAGQGQAFINAARKHGLNEAYLLAHTILESGWGKSTLASGWYYDGTYDIKDKNGKVLIKAGTHPAGTYYNFFGIKAFDYDPLNCGRAAAVEYGWSSPERAIDGAAQWIARWYVHANQYPQVTLYEMKWDPARSQAIQAYGYHQYATDPRWAESIGKLVGNIYTRANYQGQLSFLIPSYR